MYRNVTDIRELQPVRCARTASSASLSRGDYIPQSVRRCNGQTVNYFVRRPGVTSAGGSLPHQRRPRAGGARPRRWASTSGSPTAGWRAATCSTPTGPGTFRTATSTTSIRPTSATASATPPRRPRRRGGGRALGRLGFEGRHLPQRQVVGQPDRPLPGGAGSAVGLQRGRRDQRPRGLPQPGLRATSAAATARPASVQVSSRLDDVAQRRRLHRRPAARQGDHVR